MTNLQIVINETVSNNIYTEEQFEALVGELGFIPIRTYKAWQSIGYQVKRGSKAVIKTRLWKKIKTKKEAETTDNTEINEKNIKEFIKVNASLFSWEQVEKIEK